MRSARRLRWIESEVEGLVEAGVPAAEAASGYFWKAALQVRRGGRRVLGADLLALLEGDPDAVGAAEPAYRDLRIGAATFSVPY